MRLQAGRSRTGRTLVAAGACVMPAIDHGVPAVAVCGVVHAFPKQGLLFAVAAPNPKNGTLWLWQPLC